jgi:hypothetical protein
MSEMDNEDLMATSKLGSRRDVGSARLMDEHDMTTLRVTMATILAQQNEANRRLEKIENQLEDKFVKKSDIVNIIERLASLEGNQRWVVRTVLGAVVLGVGSAFLLTRTILERAN